jgi:hypothetical protein
MSNRKILISLATLTTVSVMVILVAKSRTVEISQKEGGTPLSKVIPLTEYQEQKVSEIADKPIIKDLAADIGEDLLKKNPEGPRYLTPGINSASVITENPEKLAEEILQNQSEKISQTILAPEIKVEDLNVSKTEPIVKYLIARQEVIDAAAKKLVGLNIQKMDDDSLALIIRVGEQAAKSLLAITVPESMVTTHVEQIRLVLAQTAVFQAIAERGTDPVTAAIAVSFFPKIQEDTATLEKSLLATAIKAGVPKRK